VQAIGKTARDNQEKLVTAGRGFDIPPFKSMRTSRFGRRKGLPKPPTTTSRRAAT
jgi:hypothetical protein